MEQVSENKKQAINYLLGDMPNAERDEFEERLFLDEDLSIRLDAAENDLVDEYIRGELSGAQIEKFERHFLLAESRREKLRSANVLHAKLFNEKSVAATAAAPQNSFWQRLAENFRVPRLVWAGSLAAIVLLVLIGGLWILQKTENNQVAEVQDENQNVSIEPVTQPAVETLSNSNISQNVEQNSAVENKQVKPKASPTPTPKTDLPKALKQPQIFAFSLLPTVRSGENPTLNIPSDAEIVRLRVVHNNGKAFVKYRVELRNSEGDVVWSREIRVNEKTRSQPLVLSVKNNLLAPDSYELTLLGVTPDGEYEETNFYNFSVRKK